MRADDATQFDSKAVEKNLLAEASWLGLLRELHAELTKLVVWEHGPAHSVLEDRQAKGYLNEKGVTSPGCPARACGDLGPASLRARRNDGGARRESSLARIERCLATFA